MTTPTNPKTASGAAEVAGHKERRESAIDRLVIEVFEGPDDLRQVIGHAFDCGGTSKACDYADLLSALEALFGMIEAGTLVRDTSNDGDPKWYRTAFDLTLALANARAAIAKARQSAPH